MNIRYLLLIAVAISLFSCAGLYQQYSEVKYIADFRPYTEDGFFITPLSSHNDKYESIGVIEIEFTPGTLDKNDFSNNIYYPPYNEMLDKLVSMAKKLGANGLLSFNITVHYQYLQNIKQVDHYTAYGYAIKMGSSNKSDIKADF